MSCKASGDDYERILLDLMIVLEKMDVELHKTFLLNVGLE
jgi:hypothetical protein